PDGREIALHLDRLADRLRSAGQAHVLDARARLDRLAEQSRQALRQLLVDRRLRLTRLAASLDALSPLAVLARGYSLTLKHEDRSVIRSADQVRPGQLIITRFAQGQITSRVEPTT